MKSPAVSVIIPAYNAAASVERCLGSVLGQLRESTIDVVVVDDGPTDLTDQVIRDLKDDRITLIAQENRGPAAARNLGISRAQGEYIAFLDADDYWKPGFLQKTVDFLEMHPEAIAVSVGQIHKSFGKPPAVVPRFLHEAPLSCKPQVLDSFFAFWAEHNHVCTGSVLMRTEAARQAGGQRTEFRICEDLEFWAYLATFGKWGFLPEVLFVSDGGAVAREQGWLRKNRRRWASAPTVEEWQSRVVARLDPREWGGFRAARARVAKNLAYSMILSGRDRMAKEALAHVEPRTADRMGRMLLRASCQGAVVWKAMCSIIRLRETVRDGLLRVGAL